MISKDGYNFGFDESKCAECGGRCCTGESGYIKLTLDESERIAGALDLGIEEFAMKYLIKIGYGFSLKEKPYADGFACVFFDETNRNCGIYDTRPKQCREFPFWEVYRENIEEARKECPGIL